MTDIPPEAVQAAAERVHVVRCHYGNVGDTCTEGPAPFDEQLAKAALDAAEAVWPHDPPKRDPASTTHLVTGRSWTAARQATGHAVGFGNTPDHYLGGASITEDIRDERWEDATS